jgi:hypothetical protein
LPATFIGGRGELEELLDRHVEPMTIDMAEHPGVVVKGLLQLAGIAVGAPSM